MFWSFLIGITLIIPVGFCWLAVTVIEWASEVRIFHKKKKVNEHDKFL